MATVLEDLLDEGGAWARVRPWLVGGGILVVAVAAALMASDLLDPYVALDKPKDDATDAAKAAFKANESTRAEAPLLSLLAKLRYFLIAGFALAAAIPTALQASRASNSRKQARRDLLRRYLRMVMQRDYAKLAAPKAVRVALFVLKGDELVCACRTDVGAATHRWNIRKKTGFVARAWHEQARIEIAELTSTEEADIGKYCGDTWVDRETYKSLSWPGVAMVATPITLGPGADPQAVFLVEGRGVDISRTRYHQWDADICQLLLEEPK